jgi:ABC-2 type transport system ATP-binding protein
MGYLDQDRPLHRSFRVGEMLTYGRHLNPGWDDAAARRWLDELEIPLRARIGQLSGGQRAQVALLLCMAKRPDLLLLDEPVASLDPLARQRQFAALMGMVAERGTTVLLSSHIISELEPVCDSLVLLSASRVQLAGRIDDLLAGHTLLVGPPADRSVRGLDVVSRADTSRQSTVLVRGAPPPLGEAWQVLRPNLDELIVAYMANPRAGTGADDGSPS